MVYFPQPAMQIGAFEIKRELEEDELPQSVLEISKPIVGNMVNIKQEPEEEFSEQITAPVLEHSMYPSYGSTLGINSIHPMAQPYQPYVISQLPPTYGHPTNGYNPAQQPPFGWAPYQESTSINGMTLQGMSVMPPFMQSGQISLDVRGNMQMPVANQQGSGNGPMCFTSPNSNFVLYISGLDQYLPPTPEIRPTTKEPIIQSVPIVIEDDDDREEERLKQDVEIPKTKPHKKKRKYKKTRDLPVKAVISEWGCVPCNRMFRNRGGLLQHNNTYHSGAKPYVCKVCGKRYDDEALKQQHERRHSVLDKPHKCSQCPKQYLHANDLKRHFHLHHQETRFTCGYCGKAFDRDDHVRDHEASHENGTAKRARKSNCTDEKVTE